MKTSSSKLALLLMGGLLLSHVTHAQFTKDKLTANLGLSSGYGYPEDKNLGANSGIGTVGLSVDYRLARLFSVGVYSAYTYRFYKYDATQPAYRNSWEGWDVGVRGNFHFSPLIMKYDRLDLYVSLFSGYTVRSMVYDKSNIYRDTLNYTASQFSVNTLIGGRFYFSRHIGAFAEVGVVKQVFVNGGVVLGLGGRK